MRDPTGRILARIVLCGLAGGKPCGAVYSLQDKEGKDTKLWKNFDRSAKSTLRRVNLSL